MDSEPESPDPYVGEICSIGTPLVEVLNVRMSKRVEVYGSFRVEDDKGTLYFFNTKPIDIESVKPISSLSLTMPTRMIQAAGTVHFYLDLKDKFGNEFINESFSLNLMDDDLDSVGGRISTIFDRYLVAGINGKLGSAFVYYTVPVVAVEATVKVKLVKGDNGTSHSDVKGSIVARYGDDYDKSVGEDVKQYYRFVLYEKTSEDKALELKDEDQLPLSRPRFVVPAHGLVTVEMKLEFRHSDGLLEQLGPLKVEAPVTICGRHNQEIALNCGVLKVVIYCCNSIGWS